MLNQLHEKVFTYKLKRQAQRHIRMPKWDKVRTIALLYPTNNIPNIIEQLQQANKEVVLFTLPQKEETCALTLAPKAQIIEQITSRQFDLLIDLTQEPSLTMQYMAMYIKADFKTGRFARTDIYDLSIDTPSQEAPNFLFSQIIKYIQMINT